MIHVIGINGSPHREGNTALLIGQVFQELEKAGIATEMVHLSGRKLMGCRACFKCYENRDQRCTIKDDLNECIAGMVAADGIILGSPTYFTDVTAEMKALIDRAGMVAKANDDMLRRKVGAAVVAVRRAGALHAFDTLNHFFLIGQMTIPGSNYWNMAFGMNPGDVREDGEGMETMRILGENMAFLLKKLHA